MLFIPTASTGWKKNPVELYLSSLGSRRSSITMQNCIKNIARVLGHENYELIDWSKLRTSHWTLIKKHLTARNCSGATVNLYLNAFKAVAKAAWSQDYLPQSAYLKIQAIKAVKYQRLPKGRSLNTKECRALLKACEDGTKAGVRDKAIFALMFGCGLRRAEVVSLKMSNWDCSRRSFTFIGKGNKERIVFLPKTLDSVIDKWVEVRGVGQEVFFPRVCPGAKEDSFIFKEMLSGSIYRILQKRATLAGLGKVKPHDLRRTFATTMLANGCDVFVLQRAMGHASVNTTSMYDYRSEKKYVVLYRLGKISQSCLNYFGEINE